MSPLPEYMRMRKAELQSWLVQHGIDYPAKSTVKQLRPLVKSGMKSLKGVASSKPPVVPSAMSPKKEKTEPVHKVRVKALKDWVCELRQGGVSRYYDFKKGEIYELEPWEIPRFTNPLLGGAIITVVG